MKLGTIKNTLLNMLVVFNDIKFKKTTTPKLTITFLLYID